MSPSHERKRAAAEKRQVSPARRALETMGRWTDISAAPVPGRVAISGAALAQTCTAPLGENGQFLNFLWNSNFASAFSASALAKPAQTADFARHGEQGEFVMQIHASNDAPHARRKPWKPTQEPARRPQVESMPAASISSPGPCRREFGLSKQTFARSHPSYELRPKHRSASSDRLRPASCWSARRAAWTCSAFARSPAFLARPGSGLMSGDRPSYQSSTMSTARAPATWVSVARSLSSSASLSPTNARAAVVALRAVSSFSAAALAAVLRLDELGARFRRRGHGLNSICRVFSASRAAQFSTCIAGRGHPLLRRRSAPIASGRHRNRISADQVYVQGSIVRALSNER